MLFKILKIITLILPTSVYLFVSAVFFNITPDIVVNKPVESIFVKEYQEDSYFIYGASDTTFKGGYVIYYEGNFGAIIDEETVLKLDGKYYQFNGEVFQDVKLMRQAEEQSFRLPLAFFISSFGVFIVALIIMGKMKVFKNYPRTSVLVTLLTVTIMMYIIDAIVSNLLNVFLIATLSWAMYCVEYMVENAKMSQLDGDKKEAELLEKLKQYSEAIK